MSAGLFVCGEAGLVCPTCLCVRCDVTVKHDIKESTSEGSSLIVTMKHKTESASASSAEKKRQRVAQQMAADRREGPSEKREASTLTSQKIFSGLHAFVLQAGLGKARSELFKRQLAAKGAAVQPAVNERTTHVIVDEEMTHPRFCRIMKYGEGRPAPSHFLVVTARWLSLCLSEGALVDHRDFVLEPRIEETQTEDSDSQKTLAATKNEEEGSADRTVSDEPRPSTSRMLHTPQLKSPVKRAAAGGYDSDDSNYIPSDDDGEQNDNDDDESALKMLSSDRESSSNVSTPNTSPTKLPRGNWVCSRSSTAQRTSHNEHITEKLEVLMKTYENTRDRWRALGYKKAITALKNYGKEVTSWEEANAIPGIGTKLADKIWEIIESGHLRKIDFVCKGEDMEAIDLFNDLWGAGPTVAREWVQQGFRTLDDLREKAKLTKQQQIGLKHYHEFLERMPREEAGNIERTVRETAQSLFPGMLAVVCGSYRRGKQTCGDVDVLITHPDGKSHKGALSKILDALRQTGFITDDLIRVEEKGEQKKYMGVCKLPGDEQKHRRIDIIVAPYNEYPCALVHFTGSGHFNRSMRALAKKKGMSLSEHALRAGVVRRGQEKISEGVALPVACERDIFTHLGLEYREPHERDY